MHEHGKRTAARACARTRLAIRLHSFSREAHLIRPKILATQLSAPSNALATLWNTRSAVRWLVRAQSAWTQQVDFAALPSAAPRAQASAAVAAVSATGARSLRRRAVVHNDAHTCSPVLRAKRVAGCSRGCRGKRKQQEEQRQEKLLNAAHPSVD